MTAEPNTAQTATDTPEALLGAIMDANDEWHAIENSVSAETNPHTLYGWITGALFSAGWRLRPPAVATDKVSEAELLRAELAAFVEASLEPLDYTADGECTGWEPTDYERAKANITEMHRVLDVREGRLFDAMDERKRLDAEVARLTAENVELRRDVQLAEEAQSNAELELHRDRAEATGVSG